MPKIKMTRNRHGSPDGATVLHYDEGTEYEVPQALADAFIADHVAELAAECAEKAAPENKAEKAEKPVKNKAEKAAPENKGA